MGRDSGATVDARSGRMRQRYVNRESGCTTRRHAPANPRGTDRRRAYSPPGPPPPKPGNVLVGPVTAALFSEKATEKAPPVADNALGVAVVAESLARAKRWRPPESSCSSIA